MTSKVGSKIAQYAHDYRSQLVQEQGKSAAKMTKYDVALYMKQKGALTDSEFNSWVKEKEGQEALQLTTQQKEAIKRGSIMSFNQGLQSYLDSDEVSNFTLGNVLGFEKTTNEQTGKTEIRSKAVSRQKYNVAEEMKKQSFMNYIKSLPTPQATYTELMRSIEFEKLDNQGKLEMMLKISGEKFNEAKEKGDKQAMKDYLLEGIGMALQLSCQKIDSTVGITQFKEWAKERSGLNFLVDLVDKYVDDGDDATLSWLEKNWEGVKGFGDALDSFIGTQAVAFIGALQLAGAAAGTGVIGQAFNIATKAYFLYDGGKMMVDGAQQYYNADTKQEARQAGQEFGMGTVIFTGTLKSVIGEIQAYRAAHSSSGGHGGLPELSDGHKAILEKNLPTVQNQAQVTTDLVFLQESGVEIVNYTPGNVSAQKPPVLNISFQGKQYSITGKQSDVVGFENILSDFVKYINEGNPIIFNKPATVAENSQIVNIPLSTTAEELVSSGDFKLLERETHTPVYESYQPNGQIKQQVTFDKSGKISRIETMDEKGDLVKRVDVIEGGTRITTYNDIEGQSLITLTDVKGVEYSETKQSSQKLESVTYKLLVTNSDGSQNDIIADIPQNLLEAPASDFLKKGDIKYGNTVIQHLKVANEKGIPMRFDPEKKIFSVESENSSSALPTTADDMKKAIADAKDWDSLRALNKGMKTMPQEVKELYVQRENQLRTELNPETRGVVNWDIETHMAVTEHALADYDGLSPVWKRYIARASELPDLDPNETDDMLSPHFYDVLNEDPSFGTIDDAVNNAMSRFLAHTEKAKEYAKAGRTEDFFKEVGYAIHYLQDGGIPLHTEHGNYFHKLYRIPIHTAFECGKFVGATGRLPILKENYTPEEIPFSSLEMLFHNNALFSVQPENQVSITNIPSWFEIQQRCYDRSVNVSKTYLNYILQFMPKDADSPGKISSVQQKITTDTKVEAPQSTVPDTKVNDKPPKDNSAKLWQHGYLYPIKYTLEHKKAFLDVEKELLGHNTLSGYLHDIDKIILYSIGVPPELAHQLHRIISSHHVRNGHVQNPVQAVIDWECAGRTKSDKPLNAVEYYLKFQPRMPEIEAVFDRFGLWSGYPETTVKEPTTLTPVSPIVQESKVSVLAKPNQVEAVVPNLSAGDDVLSGYGLVKDGNHWYAPNREEMPRALTEDDIVIIGSRDSEGKPESVWFCSKSEFSKHYTNTDKYNNGDIEFIDANTLQRGQTISATKCSSGNVCILPAGTKLASNEGVTTVDPGEIVIVNEAENSIYTTTFEKFLQKYNYDPLNPASKDLVNLLEEYVTKESLLSEAEKAKQHEAITETFNRINRGQKLCELSPIAVENPPQTLRQGYDLATKIADIIESKYLSRIDVSNFDSALEQARTVLNEIYQDTGLTQAQKDAAVTSVMVRLLPKTNSHQHLKGSVPEDITLSVAESKGFTEEQLAEIREAYAKSSEGYESLTEFCENYKKISKPIKTPADYEKAIDGVMREAIKQGQIAVEIRCASDSWKDENGNFLTPDEATEAAINIIEKVKDNMRKEGLEPPKTGYVFLTSRQRGLIYERSAVYQAEAAVNAAINHPDMKFGYDVAGPEEVGYGPKDFAKALNIIKNYNDKIDSGELKGEKIGITMHAGETPTFDNGRPGYLSVEEAIEMGVDRIGHGVQAVTNPATMQKLKDAGVTVEICGVCNIQSIPVNTEGFELHPIDKFIEYGIPVTLCTDNNSICDTDVSKEYLLFLLTGHGNFMDWNAVKQSARQSIQSAFISEKDKQEAIVVMEDRINQIQNLVNSVAKQYEK